MNVPRTPVVGFRPTFCLPALLLLSSLVLSAQTAAPAAAPGKSRPVPTAEEMTQATATRRDDDVLVLSPFQVNSDEDTGYLARSTLAGTRLRSDLRDIPASVSVVTKKFMNDVNATDLSSLLIYTLGTQVAGARGNFSGLSDPESFGDFNDQLGQGVPATRIRGLIKADRTRDFFMSDVPIDSYNIDRVDISRGANAILFGLGSPAGIINSGLIKAKANRTSGSVGVSTDNYGSFRSTLDYNQVLIKDKAAIRVASMYDEAKYRIEDAFEKKRAVTLTGIYRPLPHTTIRAMVEVGRDDSNRPEMRPPWDQYSWWFAAGKPVWDPAGPNGGTARLLGTPQAPFTATSIVNGVTRQSGPAGLYLTANMGNWRSNQLGLIYQDPNSPVLGGVNIGGGQKVDAIEGFADRAYLNAAGTALVNGGMVGLNTWSSVIQGIIRPTDPLRTLYNKEPQMTDPNVFDFYHHSLTGPTKYEWGKWNTYNASLEQTFLGGNAGIELAVDKETYDNGYTSPLDYRMNLDVNERLPNGAPNPNFLRPMTAGGGFKRIYSEDRQAARATAFYQADFRKQGPDWLGYILGHHMVQANYSDQKHQHQKLSGTLVNNNFDYLTAEGVALPGSVSSTTRQMAVVHYLGDSFLAATSADQARFQGLTAFQDPDGATMVALYNPRPLTANAADFAPWKTQTFSMITNGKWDLNGSVRPNNASYAERTSDKVKSFSAAVQSFWLGGDLVSTFGWRRDKVWSYDAGLAPTTALGTANLDPAVFFPKLVTMIDQSSTSWGAVLHTPEVIRKRLPLNSDISFVYNNSSNFRIAPQRYTIAGELLPSEVGDTKEYGVRVSVLNGKFDLSVSHYETVADKASAGNLSGAINALADVAGSLTDRIYAGDNASNAAGIAAWENWLKGPYGSTYQKAFHAVLLNNTDPTKPASQYGSYADYNGDRGNVTAASALKSTGWEFEVTFNPTKHWSLTANAASVEAVRTKIAPELYDFLFNSTNGFVQLVQSTTGTPTAAGSLIASTTGSQTLSSILTSNILNNGIITTFAQEGTKTDELSKWSYRMLTSYTFDNTQFGGRIKGLTVGGAVRWSDKPLIGYEGTILNIGGNTLPASDITKPIYGVTETTFDLWAAYQRQLTKRIGWKVQLNVSNVGVGNELLPVQANPDHTVMVWRIREPQRITLTNTFMF
jgi:outer membrane receptor protein involved in Fe transport